MAVARNHCRLLRCRVIIEAGTVGAGTVVGGVVVKEVHTLYSLVEIGHIASVGAIGIGAWRVGRTGEAVVRHDVSVGRGPVSTVLDITYLAYGYAVEINHVTSDMRQRGLLAEDVSATGNAVVEGYSLHSQAAVLEHHLLFGGVDGMKLNLKLQPVAKHVHLLAE